MIVAPGWLCVARDMCPCLRPGNSYLSLEQGGAKLVKGPLCLVVQGIGTEEAEAFSLLLEGWFVAPVGWQCLLCQYMIGCLDRCTIVLMVANSRALTLQKQML